MAHNDRPAPWSQAAWFDQAEAWIRAELDGLQIGVTGAIEQIHERPWSTILRVPTVAGVRFFKASAATSAHEVAVTGYLASRQPGRLPQLLVADASRGWMIMEDGGGRLRETLQVQPDLNYWETLLPLMASLQIEAAADVERLLALGTPDRGLARLPQLYRQLVAERDWFRVDLPGGITAGAYRRLKALAAIVEEKCQLLASYAVPNSLHHGDFHDGNIFFDGQRYLFFDWGDCSVSHPFFTLRTAYVSAENTLGIEEGSPELKRLRDAYLVPWQRVETKARLLEAFSLAEQLWAISSALSWHQEISALDRSGRAAFAEVLPSLAQEFLAGFES